MIPERGLGLALKVEDGSGRALYPAVIAALRQLGELETLTARLAEFSVRPVINTRGETVGEIRATH
jgi:L-asparaginase II